MLTFDLDVIIFATGFDAVTGSFDRIDITGVNGQKLADRWADGPTTYLGVHVDGFPNMFMVGGPLASVGNFGPALEYSVDWITAIVGYMESHGLGYAEVRPDPVMAWTGLAHELANKRLNINVKSWLTGYNSNIEGRQSTRVMLYTGSPKDYRNRCDEERMASYPSFEFRPAASNPATKRVATA